MKEGPDIAHIASLIGDPARANILTALMTGKALTASELAREAGVTQQTASTHLGKLETGGLLLQRKQGRHRYFSLASSEVAYVLEALMGLAVQTGHRRIRPGPRDKALREARVCYNHLAGEMGTRLFESMVARRLLRKSGNLQLTQSGTDFVRSLGIDLAALASKRTALCRECLDWSERRSHLAGSLGRAFLDRFISLGWAKREANTRIISFTPRGRENFELLLKE